MRFDSIRISRYGCLANMSTPEGPLPSIVVILGPNESGKSTFFSFLTTLLYGFRPATRKHHPHTPWSGGDPEGRARIRLSEGSTLEVHRRLLSTAWGRVTTNGRIEDIRNRPLPVADHVSRAAFRQVYALTLAELTGLKGESWNLVQDRVVSAMGVTDLRPARTVAAEFKDDANRLWRPDKRGKPQVRVLSAELGKLNQRRRETLALDRKLRERVRERETAERRLDAVQEERNRERDHQAVLAYRMNRLFPVKRTLSRIGELRARAGAREALDALPWDPRRRLVELRRRHEKAHERINGLDRAATASREAIQDYERFYRHVADAEVGIRHFADRIAGLEALEREAEAAEQETVKRARRCNELGQLLFSSPWEDVGVNELQNVPTEELRDRVRHFEGRRGKRRIAEESLRSRLAELPEIALPGRSRLVLGLGAVTLGFALAAGLLLPGQIPPPWLPPFFGRGTLVTSSLSVALTGGVLLTLYRNAVRRARKRAKSAAAAQRRERERIAALKSHEEEARNRVAELVQALPVNPERLAAPDYDLPAAIKRMGELLTDRDEGDRKLRNRRRKLEVARQEIRDLRASTAAPPDSPARDEPNPQDGLARPDESRAEAAAMIRSLEAALRAREEADHARRHLTRIDGEKAEAGREKAAAAVQLRELEKRLEDFGGDNPDKGAEVAAKRIEAGRRADQLEAELTREIPDLGEVVEEIRLAEADGVQWSALKEALGAAAVRREALADRTGKLQEAIGRLMTEIGHLREGETTDRIDGRIGMVKAQIREAEVKRDRAFLLARLVREADRRFRDDNQSDLLLRASGHFRHITGGRYDRIEPGDTGDDSFYIQGPASSRPRRVGELFSQGTKEQVYLALRLAIIDHLDAGNEPLPLFMDEALVNWDAQRRGRAFGLLERVSKDRQVFFFTCHPAMAAEMEDRGGTIVPLG